MAAIWIKEFTGGLDTRRMAVTTPGGALIEAYDGHITRGGEVEKRAAFVDTYTLPAGTVGLATDSTGLVVFGETTAPTMPSGVAYQKLTNPVSPALDLTRVISYDRYGAKIYAAAEFQDGSRYHFYDGTVVTDWYDGRARATFYVVGGTDVGTVSSLTNITVNGVSIINSAVSWDTSDAETAELIAAEINSFTSTPDYEATAVGSQVNIVAAVASASYNGFPVVFTVADGFLVAPATGLTLSQGADSSGSFTPGRYVLTNGSKMYSTSASALHFSGVQAPTKWTTDNVGAGFIDMASQASGSEQLVGLAKYQNFLAVFAETVTMIWNVDPDPNNNKIVQTLNNTGTSSPQSITQFGDNDLFYLDESGLRSLRARDASNAASTTDLGSPVDTVIRAQLRQLNSDARDRIIGLIEPGEGRFWLIILDTIYVFSFFSDAKVSAWSIYRPGFEVEAAVVFNKRVYVRSGDKVYCYGGTGATPVYDDVQVRARLPYLDAGKPTALKHWDGFDLAGEGVWKVQVGMDPTNLDALDTVGIFYETSYGKARIPMSGESTHISPLLTSQGTGPAKLGSIVLNYDADAKND